MDDCAALLAETARAAGAKEFRFRGQDRRSVCCAGAADGRGSVCALCRHRSAGDNRAAARATATMLAAAASKAGVAIADDDTLGRHFQPYSGRAGRAAAGHWPRDDSIRVSAAAGGAGAAEAGQRQGRRAFRALCLRRRTRQRLRRTDRRCRTARAASKPRWRRSNASMASAIRWTRISSPRWRQMPPASGIALGFDRLVMLATGAQRIEQVIWTPVVEP